MHRIKREEYKGHLFLKIAPKIRNRIQFVVNQYAHYAQVLSIRVRGVVGGDRDDISFFKHGQAVKLVEVKKSV